MDQQLGLELQELPALESTSDAECECFVLCSNPKGEQESTEVRDFAEILRIHEYERQRMGRELHDTAGQLITALELSIAVLRRTGEERLVEEMIDEIHGTVQQISREIRTLAFLDYPAQIADEGLCAALRSLARGLKNRTGLKIFVRCAEDVPSVADNLALPLLRVAQEALTNVHRHANATEARIFLRRGRHVLELLITDNGRGMPLAVVQGQADGVGLRGMRHRVEAIGGHLKISSPKRGTRICACVPLPA